MSLNSAQPDRQRSNERGSIIMMTAVFMLVLFLMLGLCIDVSRIYMIRAELQNAADAAALSAARELNSGDTGIDAAVTRAINIVNTQGFEKFGVTITAANVEFSSSPTTGFMSATAAKVDTTVPTIRYVRVTTNTTQTAILFGLAALGSTHLESRSAVAGMSRGINTICDFFPIAVALPTPTPSASPSPWPAPNTVMTLTFTEGTNNSVTLAAQDYVILEVPELSGNGASETAHLTAGLTSICQTLNTDVPFHMTPSSNKNNGPKQIMDGVNTRFDIEANGYGTPKLDATNFPPDTNIREGITFDQYDNGTAVTLPSHPGEEDRRIMLVPIVEPKTYTGTPAKAKTIKFGAFFLKNRVRVTNPCSKAADGCAELDVEWIDESLIIGRGFVNPATCSTTFAVPVLYN
ncbi:MAG TPA: pilus assembly protein TadG-related protein [Pyrinomonadaceae bacterium]